jgi:hypothetical protein
MATAIARSDHVRMFKRVVAAFMWFFCGWYMGAFIAFMFHVSPALGPIIGATAAFLIAGDPRGIIWNRKPVAPPALNATPASA